MIAADHRPTTMLGVLRAKLIGLGRDEDGAALVVTLAIFFLMYLGCMGVYAISMSVKERIQLQNAADAAAYSAAVVQADTLSRIATINRAMSWTYADMTRLQMDYIVLRWLEHTCDHYDEDKDGDGDLDGLADYNINSWPYKLGLGHILGPYNGPCPSHKGPCRGWYIGADGNYNTLYQVHLNGNAPGRYRLPSGVSQKNSKDISKANVGVGRDVYVAEIRAMLASAKYEYLKSAISADSAFQKISMMSDIVDIATHTAALLSSRDIDISLETIMVLQDNVSEARKVFDRWDASGKKAYVDSGTVWMMKSQIACDKIAIAKMNLFERELALKMPGRIEACVRDVLESNLGDKLGGDMLYLLDHHRALHREKTGALLIEADAGYLKGLCNTKLDENAFLAFSDQKTYDKEFKTGINQWFVRGNGNSRTDGAYGIQRSFKHWPEGPLETKHATHSPLTPSCWNTDKLEDVGASTALFSEWQWWSDTWFCFDIYLIVPPGKITIHVNALHYKELWPSRAECPHENKPGLLGLKSGNFTTPSWSGLLDSLKGAAKSACVKKHKFRPPTFRSHDYTPRLNFGVNFVGSLTQLLGNYESIDKYHDGCVIYPDLFNKIKRSSTFKFTGYSRLYADDPHLYTGTFTGMKAMPLVVEQVYFGKAGTITVGLRRKNENVFLRILKTIEGIFKAFDPDWNDGMDTHTYVFASAKAGYKNKGDSADSREYRIDWDPSNQDWNLCQSDWDAVFVPVCRAYSLALGSPVGGAWSEILSSDEMLKDWVVDSADEWKSLAGNGDDGYAYQDIEAPKGVLRGNEHNGTLKWKELSHVMYH